MEGGREGGRREGGGREQGEGIKEGRARAREGRKR